MTTAAANSYDELPYESHPFAWTHPDRLATIARLFGLSAPPVHRCRVLELGCASGGNLIPLATSLPESRFVGVDLSRRQIADGQVLLEALALRNIELRAQSILEVDADWGHFDYIICHGVYSWVSSTIQDKILEICARQLAPCGVACISYNTYPGWYLRRMIRDILNYHVVQFRDLRDRVSQARALLNFLAQSVTENEKSLYPTLLREAVEAFRLLSDSHLFHEYMEEVNEPLFFHEFVARALAKGLQYLADAQFVMVLPGALSPAVEQTLRLVAPDRLHREQYVGFLNNESFRRSLLCHRQVTLSPLPQPEALSALHVASPAEPLSDEPGSPAAVPCRFRATRSRILNVTDPLLGAALIRLAEAWPQAVPFDSLRRAICSCPGADLELGHVAGNAAADTQKLQTLLLNAYLADFVELHVLPPRCVRTVPPRPLASPLARYQAAAGAEVTNLRHETAVLDAFERHLLRHLDGSRDRSALIEVLVALVTHGILGVTKDGVPLTQPEQVRSLVERSLDQQLVRLAWRSLIMG
jgi:SAM-dependent methyltransferase